MYYTQRAAEDSQADSGATLFCKNSTLFVLLIEAIIPWTDSVLELCGFVGSPASTPAVPNSEGIGRGGRGGFDSVAASIDGIEREGGSE